MKSILIYIVLTFITLGCQLPVSHFVFIEQIKLGEELYEISGLEYSDGLLLAHNDELGIVFKINLEEKSIVERQYLVHKHKTIKEDFEGIAFDGTFTYLINSSGELFQFASQEKEVKDWNKIKTDLSRKYDIEGLTYNPEDGLLYIACKDSPNKHKHKRFIYGFNILDEKLTKEPLITIDLKDMHKDNDLKKVSPSGIAIRPETGEIFILSSNVKSVLIFDNNYKLKNVIKLNPADHNQPEGIIFLNKNKFIISDEGGLSNATLTIYGLNDD